MTGLGQSRTMFNIANIITSYFFWSTLSSLPQCIWYYPLWNMGFSGAEVFILSSASPVLMSSTRFRRMVTVKLPFIYLLWLSGILASYMSAPAARLICSSISVAAGSLAWTVPLIQERQDSTHLHTRILAWLQGLILTSVIKYNNLTILPTWSTVHPGSFLASTLYPCIVPAAIIATYPSHSKILLQETPVQSQTSVFQIGLGLGAALYVLHALLLDSSTMIIWAWDGYPVTGPTPAKHSILTILAMLFGLCLNTSTVAARSLMSCWGFAVACIGCASLTFHTGWAAYLGGLSLAIYVVAITPVLVLAAAVSGSFASFAIGFTCYDMFVCVQVFVTAYAFVSGGYLLRERTDGVMAVAIFFLALSVSSLEQMPLLRVDYDLQQAFRSSTFGWLGLLCVTSMAFLNRPVVHEIVPYHPEERLITAGVWTVHFSLDNNMWSSERSQAILLLVLTSRSSVAKRQLWNTLEPGNTLSTNFNLKLL